MVPVTFQRPAERNTRALSWNRIYLQISPHASSSGAHNPQSKMPSLTFMREIRSKALPVIFHQNLHPIVGAFQEYVDVAGPGMAASIG